MEVGGLAPLPCRFTLTDRNYDCLHCIGDEYWSGQFVMYIHRLSKAADDVTQSERERTKRVVYSIMYGVGTLSTPSHIPPIIQARLLSYQCARL